MHKVSVALGPDKGRVFELDAVGPVTIGRRDAGVTLDDHNISRLHAQFFVRNDRWWLVDLGSTNGTAVNGQRIARPVRLAGGDQIQLGRSILVFHAAPSTTRPVQASWRPAAPTARAPQAPQRHTPVAGSPTPQPVADVAKTAAEPCPGAVDQDRAAAGHEPSDINEHVVVAVHSDYHAWEDGQQQVMRWKVVLGLLVLLAVSVVIAQVRPLLANGKANSTYIRAGTSSVALGPSSAGVGAAGAHSGRRSNTLAPSSTAEPKSSDERTADVLAAMRRKVEAADKQSEAEEPQE